MDSTNGDPTRATRWRWSALALVLALSAWIQFTVVTKSETYFPLRADASSYFSYAWNLKHYGVYSAAHTWEEADAKAPVPDGVSTPGYPLFLLAIPGMAPEPEFLKRVNYVQGLLGVLSVWLAYLVGMRLRRPTVAMAAALLCALSPHLATINIYMLTESLFLFTLLVAILASLHALESRRDVAWLGAGLAWGACCLVRPTAQFLPLMFAAAAFLLPALRAHRRGALLVLASFLLVQAPWIVRNQLRPHYPDEPSLVVSFLHHGSYPNFTYQGRSESYGYPYKFDPDTPRITRSLGSTLANIAGNFQREPLAYANWYLLGKPGKFLSWGIINGFGDIYTYPPVLSPYRDDPIFRGIRLGMLLLHWPLMLLGLAGAFLAAWRPRMLGLEGGAAVAGRLLAAVALYAIAFHMLGAPFPRYGIPFRPIFYLLAVLTIAAPFRPRAAASS